MTGWLAFVDKILARTEPPLVTALAPTHDVAPDPPDTNEDLPPWLARWEEFVERRKAS